MFLKHEDVHEQRYAVALKKFQYNCYSNTYTPHRMDAIYTYSVIDFCQRANAKRSYSLTLVGRKIKERKCIMNLSNLQIVNSGTLHFDGHNISCTCGPPMCVCECVCVWDRVWFYVKLNETLKDK